MTSPNHLELQRLRAANLLRLPQFKNRRAGPAHSKPDGSDWSPAEWLMSVLGELGEFATARVDFEAGRISFEEYEVKATKELADVQTYLDLLSARALDATVAKVGMEHQGFADALLVFVSHLGELANIRKKFIRGDYANHSEYTVAVDRPFAAFHWSYTDLNHRVFDCDLTKGSKVTQAHPTGVDLGAATTAKFNEVSERVGCSVIFSSNGKYLFPEGNVDERD